MTTSGTRIQAKLDRHRWRIRAFRRLLLPWFPLHGRSFPWREPATSRYALVVSEILLQRTRAETVAGFYPRFIDRFPGWNHLAAASDEELQGFLQPIGLWRRRAKALRTLAREMQRRRGQFPASRDEVEALPGIGQYVASAALMFCHSSPEPLLDVNMARVLERCFAPRKLVDIRHDPWLQAIARAVVDHHRARHINWAVLDLAATVCLPRKPLCSHCPVRSCCQLARDRRRSIQSGTTPVTVTVSRHARRTMNKS